MPLVQKNKSRSDGGPFSEILNTAVGNSEIIVGLCTSREQRTFMTIVFW